MKNVAFIGDLVGVDGEKLRIYIRLGFYTVPCQVKDIDTLVYLAKHLYKKIYVKGEASFSKTRGNIKKCVVAKHHILGPKHNENAFFGELDQIEEDHENLQREFYVIYEEY